jgi:Mlc titration factor MtfA (ptsG expression regulator)
VQAVIAADVALARRLAATDRDRLATLTAELVDTKRWEAIAGMDLDDRARIVVAANAALVVLNLGLDLYRDVMSILVRPDPTHTTDQRHGPADGVFDDTPLAIDGLAVPNRGPLLLVWEQVEFESRNPQFGHNVVIHEFAHKIDMADGYTDGIPPLGAQAQDRWHALIEAEFSTLPDDSQDEVLDPYAWTNPAEFFAVATETFFCRPSALAAGRPRLYARLSELYRQDPAYG